MVWLVLRSSNALALDASSLSACFSSLSFASAMCFSSSSARQVFHCVAGSGMYSSWSWSGPLNHPGGGRYRYSHWPHVEQILSSWSRYVHLWRRCGSFMFAPLFAWKRVFASLDSVLWGLRVYVVN